MMGRAISATVNFHNLENMARPGGICVANHTSPIDVCILCQNNVYAMVSEKDYVGIQMHVFVLPVEALGSKTLL